MFFYCAYADIEFFGYLYLWVPVHFFKHKHPAAFDWQVAHGLAKQRKLFVAGHLLIGAVVALAVVYQAVDILLVHAVGEFGVGAL